MSTRYLLDLAFDVKLVHRRKVLRAEEVLVKDLKKRRVKIFVNTEIEEIKGKEIVTSVILSNNKTGKTEVLIDGLFVHVGESPNSQIAQEARIYTDNEGSLLLMYSKEPTLKAVMTQVM
jgi:thioredoxin reductase (NADPH)